MSETLRILHTSDWHLGKHLGSFSRLPEQELVLEEICVLAEENNAECIIVAGDIFDNYNPPVEAVQLFFRTVKRLSCEGKKPVLIIAGNHDSAERIESPSPLAFENGIIFAGYNTTSFPLFSLESGLSLRKSEPGFAEFSLPGKKLPLRILFSPHIFSSAFQKEISDERTLQEYLSETWKASSEKNIIDKSYNILIGHFFMQPDSGNEQEESEEEKTVLSIGGAERISPAAIPDKIHYAALGHLHRFQSVKGRDFPIIYSGSPIAYSLSESEQEKKTVIADLDGTSAKISTINLKSGKRIFRKSFHSSQDAVLWLKENQNCLAEITIFTDRYLQGSELREIRDSHSGILSVRPILSEASEEHIHSHIDMSKSVEELFIQFHTFRTSGLSPSSELMDIFREAAALKGTEK